MRPDSSMPDEGRAHPPAIDVQLAAAGERAFAAIVSLRGEHDLATAPEVSDAIRSIDGNVLIDLSECSFLDSTVIGVLFARNVELERAGKSLEVVVARTNAGVARTLELVRMHEAIVVHEARPDMDRERSTGA
jgi:anti-anti-sigma factor